MRNLYITFLTGQFYMLIFISKNINCNNDLSNRCIQLTDCVKTNIVYEFSKYWTIQKVKFFMVGGIANNQKTRVTAISF